MRPYKGYLIDTYADIIVENSGFGAHIPGPSMQVWRTRIIEAATGTITLLPPGSSEKSAEREINRLTDPTSRDNLRDNCYMNIQRLTHELECTQVEIGSLQNQAKLLEEEIAQLKIEYKELGGTDE